MVYSAARVAIQTRSTIIIGPVEMRRPGSELEPQDTDRWVRLTDLRSQMLILPSSLPETTHLPSGWKETEVTF